MKLNHDLVRKVMLYLEDNLPFDGQIISYQIEIEGYSTEKYYFLVLFILTSVLIGTII